MHAGTLATRSANAAAHPSKSKAIATVFPVRCSTASISTSRRRPSEHKELSSDERAEASQAIREWVLEARKLQHQRFAGKPKCRANAQMSHGLLKIHCKLDSEGKELLHCAMEELHLSARAYDRILKVARTIADLAGSPAICPPHVLEAIQYRTLARNLWH